MNHANWNGKCIVCGSRMYLKDVYNVGLFNMETNMVMKCLDETKTGCFWYHWVPVVTTKQEQKEIVHPGIVN